MECSVLLCWYVCLQAKAGSIQLLNMSKPTDTQTLVPPSPSPVLHHETLLVPLPPIPLILRKPHNNKIAIPAQGRPLEL